MRPERLRRPGSRAAPGLGLAAAVALLTVVALFAASVLRLTQTGARGTEVRALGLRAFLAAESGTQLALNRLLPPVGGGTCADRTWDLGELGLRGCTVEVTCTPVSAGGESYVLLRSEGACGPAGARVRRVVEVGALP